MQKETKNYAIVTYSCRGSQIEESKGRVEGVRLLDWIRDGGVKDEKTAVTAAGQLIELLRRRALSGSQTMRGHVDPYIFVVDTEERIRLLDLQAESNQAAVRKIQTASVMRYFTPEGFPDVDTEGAEVYGFARVMQFALEYGPAGKQMGRTTKVRWRRFLDRCMSKGIRGIRDFDRAQRVFRSVGRIRGTGRNGKAPRARRPLLAAACVLSAILLIKKGVYDQSVSNELVRQDQIRMTGQIQELEESVAELRDDQKKLSGEIEKQ